MRQVRPSSAWLGLLGTALALGGCDPTPAPTDAARLDAGPDAPVPPAVPISLEVTDALGNRLRLSTDPLTIEVTSPSGEALLEGAPTPLEAGIAPLGDFRYHSPLDPEPRSVTWSPLVSGVEMTSASSGTLRDALGRTARVELSVVAPGALRARVAMTDDGMATALMRVALAANATESFQGLGERFLGADARGEIVPLQLSVSDQARESGTNEHHVPVPFVVSSRGWGLFVESREAGAFDVASTAADELRATFEGPVLDLVFFAGPTPPDSIAAYTRHTGLPVLPPVWAFAPMHWRNEWADRAALEADAASLRALDLPCTSFWIDNPWQLSYNDHRIDETRFPGAAAMLSDLRAQGFRPLFWTTPYLERPVEPATPTNHAEELYLEAETAGHLVILGDAPYSAPSGVSCCGSGGMIDFTSAAARSFWRAQLEPLVTLGARAFKLDYGEDILSDVGGGRLALSFSDGTSERETHGLYATLYHRPYREVLDSALTGGEGGFLLARAEAWGGQSITDIIWPGDLDADMSVATEENVGGLPAAIAGLVSLAASGFPHFGSDTGGYRGGTPDRETLLRWAEHTAFSPIMQVGGGGDHHDPWLPPFDVDDGVGIYRRLARAHMELVPYFRVLALRAHTDGTPPILHPALAYPADAVGYADPNAYLVGEDLFVAPVVAPGAVTRALHLPPGRWVHWWSGAEHTGDVVVAAPIGETPAFVRVGAILPLAPPDLDTLVETTGDTVVGPEDRPYLRARILPAGTRTLETEEGLALAVTHTAAPLTIDVTPSATGLTDVRLRVELTHAEPPIPAASVTSVSVDGTPIAAAAAVTDVTGGCDGACWFLEGDVLWISVRRGTPTRVTVP